MIIPYIITSLIRYYDPFRVDDIYFMISIQPFQIASLLLWTINFRKSQPVLLYIRLFYPNLKRSALLNSDITDFRRQSSMFRLLKNRPTILINRPSPVLKLLPTPYKTID